MNNLDSMAGEESFELSIEVLQAIEFTRVKATTILCSGTFKLAVTNSGASRKESDLRQYLSLDELIVVTEITALESSAASQSASVHPTSGPRTAFCGGSLSRNGTRQRCVRRTPSCAMNRQTGKCGNRDGGRTHGKVCSGTFRMM